MLKLANTTPRCGKQDSCIYDMVISFSEMTDLVIITHLTLQYTYGPSWDLQLGHQLTLNDPTSDWLTSDKLT